MSTSPVYCSMVSAAIEVCAGATGEHGGCKGAEMILFTDSDSDCRGSLLVLPHTSYVTLGSLLNISEPQSSHL